MKFRAVRASAIGSPDAVVAPLFSDRKPAAGLARGTRAIVERIAKEHGAGRLYATTTHFGERGRVVVVGAGKRDEYDVERARNVASAGIRSLWRSDARRAAIFVADERIGAERAAQATVEGAVYAMWRPEAHRTREEERRLPELDTVLLVTGGATRAAIARGLAIGQAVNVARRLANEPANKMTPSHVAEEAKALAKASGVRCEVFDEAACRKLGMNSFLSVAQGSHQPPRLVVLRYQGRPGKGYDIAFVGKGITFDSGGISIKPAEDMHKMKADMTGAASVIAALCALGSLRPKVNAIAVAPCTENLPGGAATKPGDVFTAMSGKTVEVINTDAEGRLVLVDGISYAQRQGAKRVVDVATLTGAIVVALGDHFTGLFGKPASFVDTVREVATAAGDRVWPMPLTDEYRDQIKSDVADLKNTGGRQGGAITAAAFLDSAVEEGTEWAHLDIAGTFWSDTDRPPSPKGPQGPAVRTLIALAEQHAS